MLYKVLLLYKKTNLVLYPKVKINKYSQFEGYNVIYKNTEFTNSYIGRGSYIANNSIIRKTRIGRFCSIGDYVRTGLGIHPTNEFVSTHPSFFSLRRQAGFTLTDKQKFDEHRFIDAQNKYYVSIGNDVWIGNNVMILDGINIGDGAIIAAGSIVTENIPPYAIVGGIPARTIRYRFNDIQINKLLEIKWWNWDIKTIESKSHLFENIEDFLNMYV